MIILFIIRSRQDSPHMEVLKAVNSRIPRAIRSYIERISSTLNVNFLMQLSNEKLNARNN